MKPAIATVAAAFLAPFALLSATYYASPDGTGTGTEDSPCSITAGINKVKQSAHTLILKRGRYYLSGAIAFNGTTSGGPTQVLGETGDPADVILDAQRASEVMRINRNVLVAGITMMNGSNAGFASSAYGNRAAGIRVGYNESGVPQSVVSNCVITCCTNAFTADTKSGNTVIYGGAVCVFDTGLLVDSIVTNNTAAYRCGGVVLKSGEVRGCTISNNSAVFGGGGVFMERNSSGLVADSIISGNDAGSKGGGGGAACFIDGSSITFTNCTISGNTSGYGGGVDVQGGVVRFLDCRFEDNSAVNAGGGLRVCLGSKVDVSGCVFDGNRAHGDSVASFGGGCAVYSQNNGGFLAITNSVFRNNHSAARGGGFSGDWGAGSSTGKVYAELMGCVFTNNTSYRQGAGICVRDQYQDDLATRFIMRNCLVAFNKTTLSSGNSGGEGAGVYFVAYANPIMDSCTIVSNRTAHSGAGIYHRWSGTVTNCVIAFNMKGNVMETGSYWCLNGNATADPSAYRNCCMWPALTSVFLAENGCVNADPRFKDAAHGDFTLGGGSPCRDTGVNEDWMVGAFDLLGRPRIVNSRVDIGCYESPVRGMRISIK
jgi:hypothetical protein